MHPDAHGQANKLFTCHNLNGDLSKKNTMHYLIDRFSYYSTCKYIKACEQNKTNYLSFLQTHYYSDPADFTCCLLEQSEHHSQSLIFMMLSNHKFRQVVIVTSMLPSHWKGQPSSVSLSWSILYFEGFPHTISPL